VDSICLAGGSVYGFEAISGIYPELFSKRDFSVDSKSLGSVIGAILYDFGCRDNAIYPDAELARAAFRAAVPNQFPIGRVGAGSSASVGKLIASDSWEFAGQGGAFRQLGPTKIAGFSVVNAYGAICDRTGNIVRGNLDRVTGKRVPFSEKLLAEKTPGEGENTTLTVLVTNQKLNPFGLRQLGKQVHSSMARAIQPFNTWRDGDVFFTVSTEEVENAGLSEIALGAVASELAWDAVLSCF